MYTYTLRILAQVYENYGSTNNPYWKPKGGVEYTAQVTGSMRMYASDDEIKDIACDLLTEESNSHQRFEYLQHDYADQPIEVTDRFKALFNKKFQTEVE